MRKENANLQDKITYQIKYADGLAQRAVSFAREAETYQEKFNNCLRDLTLERSELVLITRW